MQIICPIDIQIDILNFLNHYIPINLWNPINIDILIILYTINHYIPMMVGV